jgi:hypothetical protein
VGGLLKRIFFWNYERGTVPYDIVVLAIVAFVFLTPRNWFHDQAETRPATEGTVIPCAADQASPQVLHCQVPAALLTPQRASPQLQEKAHDVLLRNAPPLKNRPFQIMKMEPVLGPDGGVLYYEVAVKQ